MEPVIIAVTARGPMPDSAVDERFGRAYWLLIFSIKEESWHPVDNSANRNASRGAGFQTAQTLVDLGVDVLLTGETGPKAFRVLDMSGIEVFHNVAGTASEALEAWRSGALQRARGANENGSPYCLMGERRAAGYRNVS